MARRRTVNKSKIKKPRRTKKNLLSVFLIIVAMALYLGVIWFFVTQTYQSQPTQAGSLSSGETFASEDFSKSLDLRIATKATYASSTLRMIKDLGSSNGIDEQIINFAVPTDKLSEYALMTMPSGQRPASGWPVIILCHGYYNPEQYVTSTGYTADMDFYSQHGYAVIKPDYRGQGLSIHQGSPTGAYYSMDYNTDVMSLITAVKKTSYLNKNNINLWGHSMGAYIALRSAVLSPEIKNVILLSGPVGTPKDMFDDYMAVSDADNPVALKLRQTTVLKYGTPATNPKFWNTTAPINYVSQLNANVEIYVGTDDHTVPPVFSAELDTALSNAHKIHEYQVFDGANHGLDDQRPDIWQTSLQQLDKTNQQA